MREGNGVEKGVEQNMDRAEEGLNSAISSYDSWEPGELLCLL